VAVASISIAAAYLAAAVIAALAGGTGAIAAGTPPGWLPLHLALAGGASTAIAGLLPFFAAALAAGRPAPHALRAASVALVACGAALVAARAVVVSTALPVAGGTVYLTGIAATALALRSAGRGGLAARRPVVALGYALALANVAIGASLGTLYLAGWEPVVARWGELRPAHAWTNLVGFVSLVIAATLVHFLPTVLGTRIAARRGPVIAVAGIGAGSPLVVAALAIGSWTVLVAGGAVTGAGALALAVEALRVTRARGRWTTDPGWHLLTGGGLLAAITWFEVGIWCALGRLLDRGPGSDAWSTPLVGIPLALGWVVQVLIASWTHLIPAIGIGRPIDHARQRQVLGRGAAARLALLNAGVAAAAVGWPLGVAPAVVGGLLAESAGVLWSVGLAFRSLRIPAGWG